MMNKRLSQECARYFLKNISSIKNPKKWIICKHSNSGKRTRRKIRRFKESGFAFIARELKASKYMLNKP